MDKQSFEQRMRGLEYFHGLRMLPGAWAIVRVDGHGFSRFTADRFEKPYDERLRDMMLLTAQALLEEFMGLYVYTQSDEISLLLPPTWDLYDREVEKLVSLSAGLASATFALACGAPAHFDSRIWLGVDVEQVVDYMRWRQADATRNALHGWCYWTLRKEGLGVAQASSQLLRASVSAKNELLFQRGINFNSLPAWQRRGSAVYWERYEKQGFNPKTQQPVTVSRRRVKVDLDLPAGQDYDRFMRDEVLATRTRVPGA